MREITIKIEKMAFGGAGVGHADGKVCFVPFTAPGDVVRVGVRMEKRSYIAGTLIEILEASPMRVNPTCPVFGTCGGCNWQHLTYDSQLEQKQRVFVDIMWRSGRTESELILPIIPAQIPFAYRSRVQLKVRLVAGKLCIGFYKGGSHFVVDLPGKCPIADPVINQLVPELYSILTDFPEPDKIPQIDVTAGDNGLAVVIFHYIGTNYKTTAALFIAKCGMIPTVSGVFLQNGRKSSLQLLCGTETLEYSVPSLREQDKCGLRLTFTSGGFSQVNYRQNRTLVSTVASWAALTGTERLLDLYCGNGNFAVSLAGSCREMVGIEEYGPSISDARQNCGINGVGNAILRCSDAKEEILEIIKRKESFDVIVLDPPRTGAEELVKLLPALNPRKIVYISCDPPTLARDIGILKRFNYNVIKCQPIDMFPQTYHIESITLLEPCNGNQFPKNSE